MAAGHYSGDRPMSDIVLLSSLWVLPMIGLVILLFVPQRNDAAIRWVSLAATLATFVASLVILAVFLTENRAQTSLRERAPNNVVTVAANGELVTMDESKGQYDLV